MIRAYLLHEFKKFGATAELLDRVLVYGEKPYIAWLVKRMCGGSNQTKKATFEAISAELGISYRQVVYAFFENSRTPLAVLERKEEYIFIREVLNVVFPNRLFWDSLLPYAYKQIRNLVIEQWVHDDGDLKILEVKLNVSRSKIYEVRKKYLQRLIMLQA